MKSRDLLDALMLSSATLHATAELCRKHGREDLAQYARQAGWDVAAAISSLMTGDAVGEEQP